MSSKFTGDHDVVVELSDTMLSALVAERLVGVMRFGMSAIRIGAVKVEALAMAPGPRVEITATITHGTLRSASPPLVLRGLDLTLRLRVPVELVIEGSTASIRVVLSSLTANDLWWSWGVGALASIQAQAAKQGITWNSATEDVARAFLANELKTQSLPPIPIPGIAVDPSTDAFPTASPIRARRLELFSRARDGSSPSIVALLATFMAAHTSGSAAKKTRTIIGSTHQLALGLSPEAARDGVICPMLAKLFGTTTAGLCPVCGTGSVSLKDRWNLPVVSSLELTSVGIAFEAGHVRASCTISGSGPAFTVSGSISVLVGFTLETSGAGTQLVARATLESLSVDIDTNDFADIFSLGATQAAAEIAASVIESKATSMFDSQVANHPIARIPLPAAPGGISGTYDSVTVDEDGIALYAKVPITPKKLPRPVITLEVSSTQTLTEVGRGAGGSTCLRSGYGYTDYDAQQTITVRLVTSGLEPIVARAWSLSGNAVPPTGGNLHIATTTLGAGPDAQDDVAKLVVSLDASGNTLSLRNDPADGNYMLTAHCVLDDGVDLYTVVDAVSVDGQPRVWEDDYARDKIYCIANTVSLDWVIRWPASDPGGREIPRPSWGERPPEIVRGPWWNPPGSPWTHNPMLERLFQGGPGGVARSASGELVLRRMLSTEELAVVSDAEAFRTAPREVAMPVESVEAMRDLPRFDRRETRRLFEPIDAARDLLRGSVRDLGGLPGLFRRGGR